MSRTIYAKLVHYRHDGKYLGAPVTLEGRINAPPFTAPAEMAADSRRRAYRQMGRSLQIAPPRAVLYISAI
jgi:hypothetical protein